MNDARFLYCGNRAKLATLHAEKRVIELIVVRLLGLRLEVVVGLNTNAFGSFNLGIEQSGSQLEVPKAKIRVREDAGASGRAGERAQLPSPSRGFAFCQRLRDRRSGMSGTVQSME